MIVLDENILDSQRLLLESWRFHVRQIGVDFGAKGIKDPQVLTLLLRDLDRPTLVTRDQGFYLRHNCHPRYALVVGSIAPNAVAALIRQFLRHPAFRTKSSRMGRVIRLSTASIHSWRLGSNDEEADVWVGWPH